MTRGPSVSSRLYAFGSNGAGQLGVGHCEDLNEPQSCLFNSPSASAAAASLHDRESTLDCLPDGDTVRKLVAGGNHTVILTASARIYCSGSNEHGKCGLGVDVERVHVFTLMERALGQTITDVAATWDATFLVENGKKVWVCGGGSKGELGLGEDIVESEIAREVFDVKQIEDETCSIIAISGTMSHVVMVLSNGRVYGWGSARKGQMGQNLAPAQVIWSPQQLQVPFNVSTAVVGRQFTFLKSRESHRVLFGPLQTSSDLENADCTHPDSLYLAGWSTLYVVYEGRIRGFGEGRRGQLQPHDLPPVKELAVGSEHCLALLEDRRVAAWGWGEHGNCGLPVNNRGNVVDRFNTISIDSSEAFCVDGVGAGCATSFIWTTNPD